MKKYLLLGLCLLGSAGQASEALVSPLESPKVGQNSEATIQGRIVPDTNNLFEKLRPVSYCSNNWDETWDKYQTRRVMHLKQLDNYQHIPVNKELVELTTIDSAHWAPNLSRSLQRIADPGVYIFSMLDENQSKWTGVFSLEEGIVDIQGDASIEKVDSLEKARQKIRDNLYK